MPSIRTKPVLVSTLGTNPQVVTLAADMLAEDKDILVQEVYVLHTEPAGRIGDAVNTLEEAFAGDSYRRRPCELHLVEIRTQDGRAVPDIRSQEQAHAAFQAIFGTVRERKQAGETVHLCIAGGRNSMVVYGAAAAHILFGSRDQLWHIISEPAFERTRRLHRRRPTDAQLAAVPVMSWTAWLNQTIALWTKDPFEAYRMQRALSESQDDRDAVSFLEKLSPAEHRVLVAFVDVTNGGSNQQIAEAMGLSRRTIEDHLHTIYEKMINHLKLPDDTPPRSKRTTLVNWFAHFFARHPELRSVES
jgi:CRISPR-associated protein Csx14